jgi:hypothetical protein
VVWAGAHDVTVRPSLPRFYIADARRAGITCGALHEVSNQRYAAINSTQPPDMRPRLRKLGWRLRPLQQHLPVARVGEDRFAGVKAASEQRQRELVHELLLNNAA